LQDQLATFCQKHGILFCGPNCVGYVNLHDRAGTFSAPVSPTLQKGCIGAIAQSGSVALALANSNRGIGFSCIVSSGNEAVLDTADYLEHFVRDDNTRVIAAFIEGIRRPDAFGRAAARAAAAGKPVIALKVGRSDLARRTVVSHTGALAGADQVHDAFFDKYGVIRVDDLDELLETAAIFSHCHGRLPRGDRVGMVTVSGGEIGLVGDMARSFSFTFPALSESTKQRLRQKLPAYTTVANPLDAWGSGDLAETYPACLDILAREPSIDVIAVSQDSPPGMSEKQVMQYTDVAKAAVRCASSSGDKPVVVFSHVSGGLHPALKKILDAGGVPFLQGTRESLGAMDNLIKWARYQRDRQRGGTGTGRPPEQRAARAGTWKTREGVLGYRESKALLSEYGIAFPQDALATTVEEAARIAGDIGYPVVIKGQSPEIPHKTDAGLVWLNLKNEEELRQAFTHLMQNFRSFDPGATLEGVLVQPMILQSGVEMILGITTDPMFGPAVVLGLGGIFVEVLDDSKLGLPPLTPAEARRMIRGLRGRRLLDGFRGNPPADTDALAHAIVQMGRLADDYRGMVSAVDINPLLVLPEGRGVLAADALVELAPRAGF
jgi:acyl-CoA synthetase (NDP forming)